MVELVELRGETSKTYDIGDGKRRMEVRGGAIHYKDSDGNWQDIDAGYSEPDSGAFTAKFTKLPYVIRMGDDGYRRIYPDRNDLSYWIDLGKPFANMGMPVKEGGYWVWDYPNATIKIRISNNIIKFSFIVKNTSAPTSISFPFAVEGITREGGNLLHDGKVVAVLVKPTAVDAEGTQRDVDVSFGGGKVSLSLDITGLVFPIDVDPTLTVQPPAKDSKLSEWLKDTTYGAGTFLRVCDRSIYRRRSLVQFSLSSLPVNSIINDAVMSLYYYGLAEGADPVGKDMRAYRLTQLGWVESEVTWNDYKASTPWTNPGAEGDYTTTDGASTNMPSSYGWVAWNVTALADWAYDNSVELGLLFRYHAEDKDATERSGTLFYSKEYTANTTLHPKLVIDYTARRCSSFFMVM